MGPAFHEHRGIEFERILREGVFALGYACRKMPEPRHHILNLDVDRTKEPRARAFGRALSILGSDATLASGAMATVFNDVRAWFQPMIVTASADSWFDVYERETSSQARADVLQAKAMTTRNPFDLRRAVRATLATIDAQHEMVSVMSAELDRQGLTRLRA